MGKTVSQKKFLKGLNAGTGVLTEPPGTVTRISNMVFTQRGSLSTVDGSAIIGQLTGTNTIARAIGAFSNFSSGQYPYYPTLTTPTTFTIPNVVGAIVTLAAGSGSPNAAGIYAFAIVASNSGVTVHSDSIASIVTGTSAVSFGSVTVNWSSQVVAGLYYSLYYLPGGAGATQGVLISGPTLNNGGFTAGPSYTLPATPLVTLPTPNNSYSFGLSIGNIAPPSKQVFFTSATFTAPAFPPQPCALAPGDPNFQFQSTLQNSATYSTGGASQSASQTGAGTNTGTSSNTPAYPSEAITAGQTLQFTLSVSYTLTGAGVVGGGGSQTTFQYSPDNGSTWNTAQVFGTGGTNYNVSQTTSIALSISGVTNLDNVLFRVVVSATCGSGGGTFTASGTINSASVTISAGYSFTPYGGIAGYVEPIPQILQFNQLSILILGNGYAPRSFDPSLLSGTTVSALTNTFQSTYPAWQASVAWNTGDSISVTISAVDYQMTVIQPGVSGTPSAPSWTTTLGATFADGQVVWQNKGAINTSVAPRGAAHGIVYAGSLWLYNTSPVTTADQLDGPTCLKMSDSNNQNSWNPANIAFLGKDDGTQGTGLATFSIAEVGIAPTASLVCFKEFSTYQVLGVFGASDFQIVQAQTNLGCIGARSIQFLPGYGIIRLTHMGFAIFNGVNDTLVSEEIRPYLFGGTGVNADILGLDFSFVYLSQGCQSTSPPMYVCACPLAGANGSLSRLFIYDLVLKAWTIMDLPWPITVMLQALAGEGMPLTIAAKADGSGAISRMFAADSSWDAASLVAALPPLQTPIAWKFKTTHVFREGSSLRQFYRSVILRGYSTQITAQQVTITVEVNGNPFKSYQTRIQPQPFSGQFELQIDLMLTAQNVQIRVAGTGVLTMDGIDWNVTEKVGGQISVG